MSNIIQTIQYLLNISNKQEKNTVDKILSIHNLNTIVENTVLGVKLNFQCDSAIDKFKKNILFDTCVVPTLE